MEELIQEAIDSLEALKNRPLNNVEVSVNNYGDNEFNLSINVNYKKGTLIHKKEGKVFITEEEKERIYTGDLEPTVGMSKGDKWYDKSNSDGVQLKEFDGNEWLPKK